MRRLSYKVSRIHTSFIASFMGLSRHERRTERRVQWRHVPPPPRIQCWRRVIGLHVCAGALSTLHGGVRGVKARSERTRETQSEITSNWESDFPNESWVIWGSVADPQITNFHFSPLRDEGIRPSFTDASYFASQYPRPCHRDTHWKTCVFLEWSLKDALKDPLKDVRNLNTLYERRRLVYEPESIYNWFYHS